METVSGRARVRLRRLTENILELLLNGSAVPLGYWVRLAGREAGWLAGEDPERCSHGRRSLSV